MGIWSLNNGKGHAVQCRDNTGEQQMPSYSTRVAWETRFLSLGSKHC